MEPIKRDDVFDREDFLYQIKWDGVRVLAGVADSKASLINKGVTFEPSSFPNYKVSPNLLLPIALYWMEKS